MRAKKRALYALLGCVLLLCGALAALLYQPPLPEIAEASPDTLYHITQLPLSALAAVQISNAQSDFALLQTPEGIEVISRGTQEHYAQAELRSLLYAACNLTSNRKITEKDTFAQYGLDAPEAEITLRLHDGGEQRLLLLMENPVDGNRYLYSEQEDAVFLLSAQVAALFLRSEKDFISHFIFPISSEADFAGVRRIEIVPANEAAGYAIEQTSSGFFLVNPVRHRLPAATVRQQLLENVMRLYADEIVETDADFADYGLDKPFLSLSLTVEEEIYHAAFAEHAEWGCLMGNPDTGTVYKMNDDTPYLLAQGYADLMNGRVLNYAMGDIRSLRLSAPELPDVLLQFSGSGAQLSITREGAAFSPEAQDALVSALNGLSLVGETTREITGQEAFTLTFTLADGSTDTISFLLIGEGMCALRVNGTTHFVTTLEAAQALLAALAV